MKRTGLVCLALLIVGAWAPVADAARYGTRTLREGAEGRDVKIMQKLLDRAGHDTSADGQFGPGTKRSLRAWERADGRAADGVLTRTDARALKADAAVPQESEEEEPTDAPEATGEEATVGEDGLAIAPASAPAEVKAVIEAGNEIAKKPYKYGGGHGRWNDSGYDCSGSISYALHGADLLDEALDSSGFMSYGDSGPGEWITIYAHGGHAYMVVAGLRFDTSGLDERGTRWTDERRSASGYTVRHPDGL